MAKFRLERPGKLDIEFTGELLADLSSRDEPPRKRTTVRTTRVVDGLPLGQDVEVTWVDQDSIEVAVKYDGYDGLPDERHTLPRDAVEPLAWSEVRIYRTDSGKYVAESLGMHVTSPTRGRVRVVDTAGEVPDALKRRGFSRQDRKEVEYLTDLAVKALELAATKDDALAGVVVERI